MTDSMNNKRLIYKRRYDGKPEGYSDENLKNECLGEFKVEQIILEDFYAEEFIGMKKDDGKRYLVKGKEVSGMHNPSNGGISYSIIEIQD